MTTHTVTGARAAGMMQQLREVLGSDWEPQLFEPGHHVPGAWVIASESGPPDWVQQASAFVNGDRQHGLFCEPVNHWSVGLYPAHCGCGQLMRADWELQLWLERPGTGDEPEKQCLHLWLCHEHKGTADDHVPQGWTMAGRMYHRNYLAQPVRS